MTLHEEAIRHQLSEHQYDEDIDFHIFSSIDSTNQFLKDLQENQKITVCVAEEQTQGRGRFGRHWHSPHKENIYASFRWHVDDFHSRFSSLSLVTSLAIVKTLQSLGIQENIQIKWPNDVLMKGKKVSGTLIETTGMHQKTVIIGIGLNVNSKTLKNPIPHLSWCSLRDIMGHKFDRNKVLAELIIELTKAMKTFLAQGFSAFAKDWAALDYLQNSRIKVTQGNKIIQGTACGVTDAGFLILKDEAGITHELSSGETSIRPSAPSSFLLKLE